jgi:DNA-binding response OmpR family regulator
VEISREVYLSFTQHARSRNIRFDFNAAPDTIMVFADKEKIEIILFNLVSNAFKFTPPGGSIGMLIEEQQGQVLVSVKDTGCGIAPGTGDRLFDSFYQPAPRDGHAAKGFGIGLYLARKLARQHKGDIRYESELDKGTVFHLQLPAGSPGHEHEETDSHTTVFLDELVEEPDSAGMTEAAAMQETTGIIDKLTSSLPSMLIVDDNADIRQYIRQVFENEFTLYEAPDGLEGYELALKWAPDIIISDIMMKTVSGIELCVLVKENPAIAHIPIILLTASSASDTRLKGIESGAEDFITKPFEKEILIARVRSILKGRNSLQQYFYNAITLQPNFTIAGEHKEFIERCIAITEDHLDDPDFNIGVLSKEIGMSHSNLYKKVKAVSGLSINVFIRYLRLRKAADLFINTDNNITEVAYIVGINDLRYFREQFYRLFQMNPSEYIKRYRRVLGNKSPTR